MSLEALRPHIERVEDRHGSLREHELHRMIERAEGRLDSNESRSGYAAPATELARYVLVLAAALAEAATLIATLERLRARERQ